MANPKKSANAYTPNQVSTYRLQLRIYIYIYVPIRGFVLPLIADVIFPQIYIFLDLYGGYFKQGRVAVLYHAPTSTHWVQYSSPTL